MGLAERVLGLAESGRLPDFLVRSGIRRLLRQRLRSLESGSVEATRRAEQEFAAECRRSEVAVVPERANEQHYEVPAAFFQTMLGPRLKYSCCWFGEHIDTLRDAEDVALETTCRRAGLEDGHRVLELGCGWGALSLWMAEFYPHSRITAVSNSATQREFIEQQALVRGLTNLHVVTADMNDFSTAERFDRVVSVEMFEHMRNHAELLRRIAGWLVPGGRLFVHMFCHRSRSYLFEDTGPQDWMARQFFSGGMMPGMSLLANCQDDLAQVGRWQWSGLHYEQTCNAWLRQLDAHRDVALEQLAAANGPRDAEVQLQRWRIFLMACAELFGYRGGEEWLVTHQLFERGNESAADAQSIVQCEPAPAAAQRNGAG